MANKDKKSGLTGGDILIAVLIALAGAIGFFVIVLIGGSLLFPESWEQTAAAPSAQPSYYGTLPSSAPKAASTPSSTDPPEETSSEPTPDEATEPVQQTVEPTAEPSQASAPPAATTALTQAPAPAVTAPPVQNTPAPNNPTQGNSNSGSSGTYSRDNWPQGKFLGSVLSDKYHSGNCRAAATILPENEIWFDSEDAACAAGYGRCGICW